jgi:hypothetical protein
LSGYANGLASQARFPEKITRLENGYNGFFAGLIDHGKLHTAFLNVHYILRGIALREDRLLSSELSDISPQTGRVKKLFHIEDTGSGIRSFREARDTHGYTSTRRTHDIPESPTWDSRDCSKLHTFSKQLVIHCGGQSVIARR